MNILTAIRNKLPFLPEQFNPILEKLNRSQRFYLLGTILGALAGFWYVTPFTDIFLAIVATSGVFLAFGIISDLLLLYKIVWETLIGKGLLLLLFAFATNLAYASSSKLVNELVKFDTSNLTYTVNLVAFLLAPAFIFIGITVVFSILLIFGQFYLMLTLYSEQFRYSKYLGILAPKPVENYPVKTFLVRFIAFSVVLGALFAFGRNVMPTYSNFIEKTTTEFIFNIDSSHYSRCEVLPTERAIKVNDTEIIVVSKTGEAIKFEPKKCVPIIKP